MANETGSEARDVPRAAAETPAAPSAGDGIRDDIPAATAPDPAVDTLEPAPEPVKPAAGTSEAPPAAPPPAPAPRHRVRAVVDVVLLLVVSLLVFAPGLDRMPLTDRDEARFVQATRQMIETGDWLDIRLQDEPRYKKPIGIYWLQGLAVTASGEGADAPLWVYRLPSLVGAVLAVLFAYGCGFVLGGPNVGLVGAALFASTVMLGFEARIAKTDAVLAASILAAQFALASAWMDPQRRRSLARSLLFFGAIGLGVLVKGPVILLVCGLTLTTLMIVERSTSLLRALRPLIGVPVALAIVLPWFIAIGIISDGAFFAEALGRDFLGKVAEAQESHGAPPGTYLLASLGTFWPAAAFIPAGIAWAVVARSGKAARFLIAWVLPAWVLLEIVPTKLPHYVLPLLPGLTIGAAFGLLAGVTSAGGFWRRASLAWLALGGLILVIGLNGAFVAYEGHADPWGLAAAFGGGLVAIAAWRLVLRGHVTAGVTATVLASAAIFALAYAWILPRAGSIWLSDRVAETAATLNTCPNPEMISIGYGEPSLVFRLGTGTRLLGPEEGAAAFAGSTCAVALVESRQQEAFLQALAARGVRPVPSAEVSGRNLNGLRLRTVRFYVTASGF